MELSFSKGIFSFILLFWTQCLNDNVLSSAGEATTATSKDVEFSGWKPLVKSEALSTSEFVEQFSDPKELNVSDSATSESKRSFLLVYPPRSADVQDQQPKSSANQQTQARNFGPPVRAYPTQSRYQRMMNFGASEGSSKRTPAVFHRSKFPPVANPPPLPSHAGRSKKLIPNYTPESTSQHQVQIQLLDGYLVPPSGGGGISAIHAKNKGAPQITTFPLSLNNVPEIRLLLPGDVHEQLTNLRHPAPQQNTPIKTYPEHHSQVAPNDVPDRPHREFNADAKIPNPSFESQRYPDADVPRNQVASNNNYQPVRKTPDDLNQQQINYDQTYNSEQRRPLNGFSQPDSNVYPNTVSFPGQGHINFQENSNQGQNHENNFQVQNGGYQPDHQLDARSPVNHQVNNQQVNNQHVNNQQVNNQQANNQQVNTQSFSSPQGNGYVQNTRGQRQNDGQVYTQQSNQPGIFPAYPSQVQRGYRGESFRPLSNGNHNNNQKPNYNSGGGQQHQNNGNFNQNQYNHNSNLGQNAWRGQQSNRGNQNHNRVLVSPDQQNYYTINNQNGKTQENSQVTQNKINFNYREVKNDVRNVDSTTYSQANSFQDNLSQQVLTEAGVFSSTQANNGQQTSTGNNINTQNVYNNDRNVSTQGNPTDQVYFIPPLPSKDDVQTQIPAFDVVTTGDTTIGSEVGTTNVIRGDGMLLQQKELETGSNGISVRPVVGGQLDSRVDKNGVCECRQSCAPLQRSPGENFGSSIREIARSLHAEAFFEFVGLTDDEIESMLSVDGPYTLFIPSNEAVSRLPSNLIDHWRESNPDFTMALLNHVIQDMITLDQLKQGGRLTSRANEATIFVNNYNNEAVTVNGHRIVHGDVAAPKSGLIHVIDGTLCPVADQDIINTLRTCNKYDGFLTLADVTKLLESMQDDGPFTVFLPSNEALTKIPSDELTILKENVTLLREFLEYHIVQGAYFSGDLKDGQYLATLHQRQPVRVGVRVDGCYRRLVEANNSPLFKSDIPTKNGVIHVVDWILRPSDLNWCEGVILP